MTAKGRHGAEWSPDRIEMLRKLWAEGLTASRIASQMGRTRNAVIGKLHRLGLVDGGSRRIAKRGMTPTVIPRVRKAEVKKAAPPHLEPSAKKLAFQALFRPEPEPFVPGEELVIPVGERQTVVTLEAHHCRWPIGDPRHDDFHFCGKRKVNGLPYCEAHARRAYKPPEVKRPRGAVVTAQKSEVVT